MTQSSAVALADHALAEVWLAPVSIGLALALDATVAEPPTRFHPVAWFGRLVASVDRGWNRPRAAGAVAAVTLPLGVAILAAGAVAVAAWWHSIAGVLAAGLALFVTASLRQLLGVADEVARATETDLDAARERLRALAGRDASDLSAGQVRSAVVESLAENLADGFVAALSAFTVGAIAGAWLAGSALDGSGWSLALGAGGAAWVKGVNTMDSMLGYREKPVGWAAARLDDVVMWVPARVTAVALAIAAGAPGSLGSARTWLDEVPSPNSGWPMGVVAAALDVRLEKPGAYVLAPGADLPTVADATRARRMCLFAGGASAAVAAAITGLVGVVA